MYHKDNPEFNMIEDEDWDGIYPGEEDYEEEAWADFCAWCDQIERDDKEMPFQMQALDSENKEEVQLYY